MTWEIREGDAPERLREVPNGSVQCCVTSPPYYRQRDYGDERQIGLEPTVDEYVARLVEVLRDVWRVLRDDGVLWLNLGDTYADKSLLMIPARVALALRDDGWFLRSDVIWAKPNPVPESVTDRPTNAHEHVFLLTKSARYFYDAEAIREKATYPNGPNGVVLSPYGQGSSRTGSGGGSPDGRRNVWEIATRPYAQAHFATFPTKLVEPCVLAGSSPKACGQCGAPWKRQTETEYRHHEKWFGDKQAARHSRGSAGTSYDEPVATRTVGWEPSCAHRDDSGRCLVVDPFAGSGTVGVVTRWHGRNFVGIELNADYCAIARRRILLEGDAGRRATAADEPIPGQMMMSFERG
jgi:site-specific DNA-methyltransferase (adenine-specific)